MKHLINTFRHNQAAAAANYKEWVKAWSIGEKRRHLRNELCSWVTDLLDDSIGPKLDVSEMESVAFVFYPSGTSLEFGQSIKPGRDVIFDEKPLAIIQLARFPDYIEYLKWCKKTIIDREEEFEVSDWGRLQDAAMDPVVDEILRQAYG